MAIEVEGRSAIAWTCPKCGIDHCAEMVAVESTDEDLGEHPELADGEWVLAPDTVKCRVCQQRFKLKYGDD